MNIIMNDAKSYGFYAFAVSKLEDAAKALDIPNARGFILVNSDGRFSPAVLQSSIDPMFILPLVHRGICVVG